MHWEAFTCQSLIYQAVLNEKLINPVGKKFLFSELSFITLTYVIGTLARLVPPHRQCDAMIPLTSIGTMAMSMRMR